MINKKDFNALATATLNATIRSMNMVMAKRMGLFGYTLESVINGINRYERYKHSEIEEDKKIIRVIYGRK